MQTSSKNECVIRKHSIYEKVLHSLYVGFVLDTDVEPSRRVPHTCLACTCVLCSHSKTKLRMPELILKKSANNTTYPKNTSRQALTKNLRQQQKKQQNMVAISNTKVLLALGLALTIHSSHAIESNLRGAVAVSSESNTSVSAYLCVEILISLPCHLIFLQRQRRGALQLMATLRTCLMLLPPGGSYPLLLFLPVS